jgi:transposase
MTFRLPDERVPETAPWRDRDFLEWAYHERGLSPRMIAYALGVSKSHITVYLERYGMTRKHRHEPTLRRLYVEQGLSAEEIAARDEFDCSPTTVRKYLARYGLTDENANEITYGRLDELGRGVTSQ